MNDASGPLLSVQDLTVSFRRDGEWASVVRNLSFDIHKGETLAIVGESGSGKSVTALSAMQLLPPGAARTTGRIMMGGRDLLTLTNAQMRGLRGNEIGMIFQEPLSSLNPVFTIGNQLVEALLLHRRLSKADARAEAVRLLDRVHIPAAASRLKEYPHQFSGGMRQRVMIAMALACRPKLLIADEPTTALDVTIQAEILELLRELQAENDMAVLFITHDMGVVAEIADRTLVMFRGDVIETGDTAHIFARSTAPYTRSLLAAIPQLGSMGGASEPRHFPTVDPRTGVASDPRALDGKVDRTAPILDVKNLTVRFPIPGTFGRVVGRVHAVENLSFDIFPGETLALVGESGCGKSTTGRAIMQLTKPTGGEVRLNGQNILGQSARQIAAGRRDIQMIFQDPFSSLNPRMTIGAAIAEPIVKHGLASGAAVRARVGKLLEQVGLGHDMAGRFPHEFSGGQRQRVSIARALALEPKVIIADEAVSALDVAIKAQVSNLLMDLQADLGLALLFISHDMAVVERISHRVAVMRMGEIVEIGPRAAVFGNPQHAYTKRLLAAVPTPDPALRGQKRPEPNVARSSAIRSANYVPPVPVYADLGDGHLVLEDA